MSEKVFQYSISVERVEGGQWAIVGSAESILKVLVLEFREVGRELTEVNAELMALKAKEAQPHA